MSQAAIQYDQDQYNEPLQAYKSLTEKISDIAVDVETNTDATYSVVWQTKNHDYGSEYRVVRTEALAREKTLIIEGQSRGGEYQVVPRGSGPAVIRYRHNDGTIGWEEDAQELIIMRGEYKWNPEDGGSIIDRIRDKLPRRGR